MSVFAQTYVIQNMVESLRGISKDELNEIMKRAEEMEDRKAVIEEINRVTARRARRKTRRGDVKRRRRDVEEMMILVKARESVKLTRAEKDLAKILAAEFDSEISGETRVKIFQIWQDFAFSHSGRKEAHVQGTLRRADR